MMGIECVQPHFECILFEINMRYLFILFFYFEVCLFYIFPSITEYREAVGLESAIAAR